jgi:hypothetical protein
MARLFSTALLLGTIFAAAPMAAQRALPPYDVKGGYGTFDVGVQVTGSFNQPRDILFSRGYIATGGRGGAWMPQVEAQAGLGTGGRTAIGRVFAGPRVSLARAFPGQYVLISHENRAEPYLLVAGTASALADLGRNKAVGFTPSVAAGAGLRVFGDAWDTDLATIEVLVERRFGFRGGETELYVRLGHAAPARRRAPATAQSTRADAVP